MCGILGIVSDKDVINPILKGLKQLIQKTKRISLIEFGKHMKKAQPITQSFCLNLLVSFVKVSFY